MSESVYPFLKRKVGEATKTEILKGEHFKLEKISSILNYGDHFTEYILLSIYFSTTNKNNIDPWWGLTDPCFPKYPESGGAGDRRDLQPLVVRLEEVSD